MCFFIVFFNGGMLLHAFADSGSCMSYVCSLHASTGCLVAGIHVYNIEGVFGFVRVVFYEKIFKFSVFIVNSQLYIACVLAWFYVLASS